MMSNTSNKNSLRQKKFLLVSHYATYAMQDLLLEYLAKEKPKKVMVINIPLPELPILKQITIKHIENGKKISEKNMGTIVSPPLVAYLIHFFQVLLIGFFENESYDVIIAQNSLLAVSGLFLKFTGKVKKVVFYSHGVDSSRFSTSLKTKIYKKLDEFTAKQADYNWVLGKPMLDIRLKQGIPKDKLFWVPTAIDLKKIKRSRIPKTEKLIFIGVLNKINGVMILPDTIKILKEEFKDIHLDIIGDGELKTKLEKKVEKEGLEDYVTFLGVYGIDDYKNSLTDYYLGLAPYEPNFQNLLQRTDPMKLRLYAAAGLPAIVTKGFHFSDEISKEKIGMAAEHNASQYAEAISELMKNKTKYLDMRGNCLNYSKTFDQEKLYGKIFKVII